MLKKTAVFIIGMLFFMCMGISCAAETEEVRQPVIIDYGQALVAEEYTIPDYTEKVIVTDPNGKIVETQGATFTLLVSGEYCIDYGEGKIQLVQVFTNPPKVSFVLEEELHDSYTAGQILYFPKAVVDNGYQQFDNYYIDVFYGEEKSAHLANAGIGTPNFFFEKSGTYRIVYGLVDYFGVTSEEEWTVTVTDKEEIFYDLLPDRVNVSATVQVGFPYGYYMGEIYDVDIRIKAPSGSETILTAPQFTVGEVGVYKVSYSADINGKKVTYSHEIEVVNPQASFYFSYGVGEVTENVPLPDYVRKYETAGTTATLVRSAASSATFYYNKIIDLNNLPDDGSLIEFVPYSEGEEQYVGYIRITLSDIYNPDNKITLFFQSAAAPYLDTSYVIVEMNGFSAGVCNENGPRYGKVLTSAGTTLYGNSMRGDSVGESRMFRMYFDYEEMAIYTEGRNNLIQYGRQIVLDLNDQNYLELSRQFKGFTTGEVVMSIEISNNKNAGLYIKSVAGNPPVIEQDLSELMIQFTSPELADGAVGYACQLPTAVKSPLCDATDEISFTLKKEGADLTSKVQNGSFTPQEAGTYVLTYSLPYRGSLLKREITWTVKERPSEIVIEVPENQSAAYFSEYFIPVGEIKISGGTGTCDITYTVKAGGEEILPNLSGGYYLTELSGLEVTVTVRDALGFTKSESYNVSVQDGTFVEMSRSLPNSVRVGQTLVLPDFSAYEISDGEVKKISDCRILVWTDDKMQELDPGASFTIPLCSKFRVEFQTMGSSDYVTRKTFELLVLEETFTGSESIFRISDGITTKVLESGIVFGLEAGKEPKVISLPNYIAADKMYLKFALHDEAAGFETFSILMTDIGTGEVLSLNFSEFDVDKGSLRLRFGDSAASFLLTGAKNRYTDMPGNEDSAFYQGKSYTVFEITVNSVTKSVENSIKNNTIAYFDRFESGADFYSFTDSACLLSFEISGIEEDSEIVIGAVTNQSFNSTIENLGEKDFDNVGPQIVILGGSSSITTSIGSTFTVRKALAYDVIQNISTVRVSLTAPNGTKIFNNVSADEEREVKLDQYGIYKITYTATDLLGKRFVKDIDINVRDEVLPTFTLDGSYKEQYKRNDKLTILGGTSSDNHSSAETEIFLYCPAGMRQVSVGETIELSETGNYELVYRTTDASHNVTRTRFVFSVS